MRLSSILLLLLLLLLATSTTKIVSAQNISTTTFSDYAPLPKQMVKACSTVGATFNTSTIYCYKNIFGNFYFVCNIDYIELLKCSDSLCSTGCVSARNFSAAVQVGSVIDGPRMYNWTGVFYTNPAGIITESTYDTEASTTENPILCNASALKYQNFYADSSVICYPWVPYKATASQKRYCANGSAIHEQYLNEGSCPSNRTLFTNLQLNTIEQASGTCTSEGAKKYTCTNGTSVTFVVFDRSGCGRNSSLLLLIVVAIIFVTMMMFVL